MTRRGWALLLGASAALVGVWSCGTSSDGGSSALDAGSTDAATDLTTPEKGEIYLTRRACADCHQPPDPADGVLSGQTTPRLGTNAYPANLTPDPDTGLGGWSDDRVLFAMRHGVDKDNQPLCATMPRFDKIGDDEGYAIIAYLRTLAPVHRAIPPSTCPPLKPPPDAGSDSGDAATE